MILLDTNAVIWSLLLPDEAPKRLDVALSASETVCFSLISLIEIGIKQAKGKLPDQYPPTVLHDYLLDSHAHYLPLTPKTPSIMARLPLHHGDPFDRLLIAQAIEHDAQIVTSDQVFSKYDVKVIGL